MVPFGGSVRLPQELIGFLDPPTVDEKQYWKGGVWNGCLLMFPDDYDNGIDPSGKFGYLPSFYSFNVNGENNPYCPREGNEIVGLTQDKQLLLDKIDNFSRSDGTGTGLAAAWGVATISRGFRGVFPNVPNNMPWRFRDYRRKIVVLMSDGGISPLNFPRAVDFDTNLPFQSSALDSTIRTRDEQATAQNKVCDRAKSLGIEIYTIGLQISNTESVTRLKNCATSDSHFYEAGIGDLGEAFETIAGQVSAVRISE